MLDENEDPIVYDDNGVDCDEEEKRFTNAKNDKEFLENIAKSDGKEHIHEPKKEKPTIAPMTINEHAEMLEKLRKSVDEKGVQRHCFTLDKILLGRFPIMVQSDICILSGLPKEMPSMHPFKVQQPI
jgi:hypothetical protein